MNTTIQQATANIPESAEKRSASAKLNGVRYLPIDLSALKAAAVRY